MKDAWTAGDEMENLFPENNELSRPGIKASERIRMLEKRFGKSDAKATDDRKVVLYGDLDRPLDENIETSRRNSTLRSNANHKSFNNKPNRKIPACGMYIMGAL